MCCEGDEIRCVLCRLAGGYFAAERLQSIRQTGRDLERFGDFRESAADQLRVSMPNYLSAHTSVVSPRFFDDVRLARTHIRAVAITLSQELLTPMTTLADPLDWRYLNGERAVENRSNSNRHTEVDAIRSAGRRPIWTVDPGSHADNGHTRQVRKSRHRFAQQNATRIIFQPPDSCKIAPPSGSFRPDEG